MPRLLMLAAFLLILSAARADPALEQRVLRLTEDLRCLVCQNQTVAESNAELAVDLRRQVREQLGAGRSEDQVRDFMVQRYGDFVLYRPPLKSSTWLLWLGPFVLLLAACCALWLTLRRRRAGGGDDVGPEDLARAEALLRGDGKEER